MGKWERITYFPCKPLGKDGKLATGCAEHIDFARKLCCEGIVLLKNKNNLLPVKDGKIALFGKASADYVAGGGGAGSVESAYTSNIISGLRANSANIYEPLAEFYESNVKNQYENKTWPGHTSEPEIPDDLLEGAKKSCDIAIISICRKTWEAFDVKPNSQVNGYYLTDAEQKIFDRVTANFEKVVLVLNIGTFIDPSFFADNDRVSAIVLGYQGGMEGGNAVADIICGRANPSGKLTDTYARLDDCPSYQGYNLSDEYVEYNEDIYVGYRFFDTVPNAQKKVCFPFGFGLSYTTFYIKYDKAELKDNSIYITVSVTNTGDTAGKEVVQVYSAYNGNSVQRPQKELRAFKKTRLLSAGETETLCLSFELCDMAYYDEKSASYILSEGEYSVLIGNSSDNTEKVYNYVNNTSVTVFECKNRCVPTDEFKILNCDGQYTEAAYEPKDKTPVYNDYPAVTSMERGETYDHILPDMRGLPVKEGAITLKQVYDKEYTLDELLEQLTDDELITLLGGRPNAGVANTAGIGGLESHGIPAAMTADGPAGLRLRPELEEKTTAFPCATLIACSWDLELAEKFGKAVAVEVKENNFGILLAPALNIHRNPLNGRNFEYFSEDPFVSGKMAAAIVKGIQSEGIAACVKHFACNNKEHARNISDSRVSERALREIYLKGFEIAIKESNPAMVMTAYNKLNGTYTSASSDLLNGILREEWEYNGLVTTDWDNLAEPIEEINAGNNLRMPAGSNRRLKKALEDKVITRDILKLNAKYVLEMLLNID